MVGFKTVWTLLILLVFAACVPQTKSTSCKSNEAFSSSLRTCIPIVGTPSSFINITDFLPTSPLVKYKNDYTPVNLEVVFVNPQNAPFTVEWVRVFNGSTIPLNASLNTSTTSEYTFLPASLGTELGTHSFQVKIKAQNGSVVDSHNFQLTINNTPRPIIKTATIEPADYHVQLTPLAGIMTFEFITDNNNSIMAGAGYRTDWKLTKNGTPQGIVDTDLHVNTTLGSGASAQNYSGFDFDPSFWGLGTYVVRAQVSNFAAEIVVEQQWTITVAHPPLAIAQGQPIFANGSGPAHTATNIAYHGTPQPDSPTRNFVPSGYSVQGNYCVNFASGHGAYVDSDFIRVDYYIDGNQLIYSGYTSAGDSQVCLTEAPGPTLAGIVFNNASPNSTQTHTITARAIDMSTSTEYTSANLNSGLSYPFVWTFSVKPVNLAPTLAFSPTATLANITCPSTAGSVKSCNVVQGQTFRVGVTVTDDFYNMLTDQAHFSYSMTLNRGAVPVSSCTKLLSDVGATTTPPTDFVGPDFLCDFAVPTYDASGSINPTADAWSVTISFADDGSFISGSSPATSAVYTYSLAVTEYSNPAGPTISPQGLVAGTSSYLTVNWVAPGTHTSAGNSTDPLGNSASASFVTEGDTLTFNVRVADPEMDDYKVSVFLCTDFTAACTTSTPIVAQTIVPKTDNVATQLTSYSYLIPENLVPVTSALTTNVDVFFKVVVADFPDFLTGVAVESIMSTNVRNKNPAPVVDLTSQLPLLTGPHNVSVGYPFSINPGNVTDASMNAAENNLTYQWYVSPDNITFAPIGGATSRILFWTPTSAFGSTAYLKMCASDGTTIYPVSANFAGVCTGTRASSTYQIAIKSNSTAANSTGTIDPSVGAVWHDTSVGNENVAYLGTVDLSGSDYYINVTKLVRETSGVAAGTWNNTFTNVRFKALQSVQAALPTELSITGTANSLYVAYKCAPASYPANAKACLRRIEKNFTAGVNEKTNLIHKGKFGFSYTGAGISSNVTGVTHTAPALGATPVIQFVGVPTTDPTNRVIINGYQFSADGSTAPVGTVGADEFCGTSVPGCTATAAAARLRDMINQSTAPELQGITATLSGTDVVIHGMKALDSVDSVATVTGVGKVIVAGSTVHLPIINKSAAGSDENRISVIYANVDFHMSAATVDINNIFSIDRSLSMATDVDDNGNLVVAVISAEPTRAGQGRLYRVPFSGAIFSGPAVPLTTSLFGGVGLSSIRLAASKGSNAFNYVAAYDNLNGKWKLGRFDENTLALSNTTYQSLDDLTPNAGTGSDDVVVTGEVQDVQLVADPIINGEARVAISNFGSTVTDGFYLLRWKATNELSCPGDTVAGACVPFSTFTTDVNSRVFLSAPQSNVTIGDAGYTAAENTTNLVHALVFTGSPVSARHMVMNIVPESIHGDDTTLPAGTSGWQPPYVK